MKKAAPILLTVLLGIIASFILLYGDEQIDFATLLKGEKIVSPTGLYDSGKAEYKPQFARFLDQLGDFLGKHPGLVIEIGGHTDNSGTPGINQSLSFTRAQNVKKYLVQRAKIAAERIMVNGYSARFPLADNSTPEGRAKNRRVEIAVVKSMGPAGRLTYIRLYVFTKTSASIDFTRAQLNQGLYHLDRVLTRERSNANVAFQDLSRINLGPQSLMVMYSLLERGLDLVRKQNVRLLTGALRTKLNKLKGALQVETPAAVINSDSVQILVGIDDKKMSALSVFDGKSQVAARGQTVEVPGGYGTVVELGQAPEPPQPLPEAPQLVQPPSGIIHLPAQTDIMQIAFQWRGVEDSKHYHFQAARDDDFAEIIEDQTTIATGTELTLRSGTYYWRAAVVNRRGIEGYSAQSSFTIQAFQEELALQITPEPDRVLETTHRAVAISGKTAPGARLRINEHTLHADDQGAFHKTVSLSGGWNHIRVRVIHAPFKEKTAWITVYRYSLAEPGFSAAFRFAEALKSGSGDFDHGFTLQGGKTFRLGARVEGELFIGAALLKWQASPGGYGRECAAIPFGGEMRLMLTKARKRPFLSAGLTAYLAFPRRRSDNKTEETFFVSPELGGGMAFPFLGGPFRIGLKYALFLKKEPFFPEAAHRLALIIQAIFD